MQTAKQKSPPTGVMLKIGITMQCTARRPSILRCIRCSDLLAGGNWFGSGHVAMVPIHQWYMGWGTADLKAKWDLAPVPSYNGVTTAKLHADTFGIMKTTKNPDAAFKFSAI